MDLVVQQDLMEDRIYDLKGIPVRKITEEGFSWYLDEDYLVNEALMVLPEEVDEMSSIAAEAFDVSIEAVERIIESAEWDHFDLPISMREMIIDSWNNKHMHLLGRMDVAGCMNRIPGKVLEFNADTPTMLPESSLFQDAFKDKFYDRSWAVFNRLYPDLVFAFKQLIKENPDRDPSMLVCSLGYEEDALNAEIIRRAAEEAGFKADYCDLEHAIFEHDGLYLEFEDGSEYRYDFFFKLIPWEFIMYEEPELLDILRDMQLNDVIYILNPAYSILMQSKAILPYLHKHFPREYILPASFDKSDFKETPHVEKVIYGRLGENIKIYNRYDDVVEENSGDWGKFKKIYQQYTKLYQDEDGYYQPGVYLVDGKPAAVSFRRCEDMIINDDSEYIPHFIPR